MSLDAIARLQDRDVERVVARSDVFAARVWQVAQAAALHRVTKFNTDLVQAAQDELIELMVFAYLTRVKVSSQRRALGKRESRKLEFASLRILVNRAANAVNIDAGNLRRRFTTLTGRTLRRRLDDVRDAIRIALKNATKSGLTGQQATTYVLEYLRKRGLYPRSDHYVRALVRTHAAIAYGQAHRAAFQGDPDLWGFEYVTMEDDRVRPSHAILHGVRRRWDDKFWDDFWPPCGWNCRCQAVAIYGSGIRQTPVPRNAVVDTEFRAQFGSF